MRLHGMLGPLASAAHGPHSTPAAWGQEGEALHELRGTVDAVMRSTEQALLMTRMLLRHGADLLAFVHRIDVPVHPSLHHKIGSKTQKLAQVCILLPRGPVQGVCAQPPGQHLRNTECMGTWPVMLACITVDIWSQKSSRWGCSGHRVAPPAPAGRGHCTTSDPSTLLCSKQPYAYV